LLILETFGLTVLQLCQLFKELVHRRHIVTPHPNVHVAIATVEVVFQVSRLAHLLPPNHQNVIFALVPQSQLLELVTKKVKHFHVNILDDKLPLCP
jgi:hypothetical protein